MAKKKAPLDPELREIKIEGKRVRKSASTKLHLTVSFDALAAILYCENGVIAPQDVPALLRALAGYANTADASDSTDIANWLRQSAALGGDVDDEEEP